jgi:phospholipase C
VPDNLFGTFPSVAPSNHLNIEAMFVFVGRMQKPDTGI